MGTVWAAYDADLGREVAVKLLLGAQPLGDGGERAFQREVRSIGRLTSPHIVRMLRAGSAPEPFLVMEILAGRTLQERLRDGGPLSRPDLIEMVRQLALALDEAHARGIVHRDVKASNIFLCDGPRQPFIKLLDFGMAKVPASSDTSTSSSAAGGGTPNAMSPEQLLGSRGVGPPTDIWAIGVLVFRCLTGQYPFSGETLGALALAVHHGPMPSLCATSRGIPGAVNTWFERACARRPEDRFESATAAATALESALLSSAGPLDAGPSAPLPERQRHPAGSLRPVVASLVSGDGASTLTSPRGGVPRRRAPMRLAIASLCVLALAATWGTGRLRPSASPTAATAPLPMVAFAGPAAPPSVSASLPVASAPAPQASAPPAPQASVPPAQPSSSPPPPRHDPPRPPPRSGDPSASKRSPSPPPPAPRPATPKSEDEQFPRERY